jgi:transposase
MNVENINVSDVIERAKKGLAREKISPSLRTTFELLLTLITILLNRLNLNSSNSSKPSSTDKNKLKKKVRKKRCCYGYFNKSRKNQDPYFRY